MSSETDTQVRATVWSVAKLAAQVLIGLLVLLWLMKQLSVGGSDSEALAITLVIGGAIVLAYVSIRALIRRYG